MGESKLEDALLDKVQEFLLELGRGFCFEARQKRIRIGDDFFFVDLVFYHVSSSATSSSSSKWTSSATSTSARSTPTSTGSQERNGR